jgi:hypothetical protein
MDKKEIKIVPPEGYEIDKENSTLECIKFKPISISPNRITKADCNGADYLINGIWAFSMFQKEE